MFLLLLTFYDFMITLSVNLSFFDEFFKTLAVEPDFLFVYRYFSSILSSSIPSSLIGLSIDVLNLKSCLFYSLSSSNYSIYSDENMDISLLNFEDLLLLLSSLLTKLSKAFDFFFKKLANLGLSVGVIIPGFSLQ